MTYPGTLCSYMLLYDKAYEEFVSLNQAKDDVYLHFRAATWRALQVVYELKGFPAPSGFDLSGVDTLPGRPIINTSDIPRFLDKCRNKVGNYYKESCAILRCWKHDLERAVMLLCDMGLEVLLPYDELNKVLGEITENNLNFFPNRREVSQQAQEFRALAALCDICERCLFVALNCQGGRQCES